MSTDIIAGIFNAAETSLSYIGAAIIVYGGAIAAIQTLRLEFLKPHDLSHSAIQVDFTHRVVLALDFLIAGDILRTVADPGMEELILLGAIVGIRTVMGYFLTKEIREFEAGK